MAEEPSVYENENTLHNMIWDTGQLDIDYIMVQNELKSNIHFNCDNISCSSLRFLRRIIKKTLLASLPRSRQ
jgi:hypothetical protein